MAIGINLTQVPDWYAEPMQKIAAEARRLTLDRNNNLLPYQEYPYPRIAPQNRDIQAAHEQLRNFNAGDQRMRQSSDILGGMQYSFPESYQQYMNPYTQEVVNRIAEGGNRNFRESILPALEAQFVGLGQHGSSKHRELAARAARDLQSEIMNRQSQALHQGYTQAGQQHALDQQRRLMGASAQGNLAAKEQGRGLLGANILQGIGQENMQHLQRGMDITHQNFLRQQAHPLEQLSRYASTIQGLGQNYPMNQGSYTQADVAPQPQQPSALSNLMNIGGRLLMASQGMPGGGGGFGF